MLQIGRLCLSSGERRQGGLRASLRSRPGALASPVMVAAPQGAETHPTSGDLRPPVVAYRLIPPQVRSQNIAQGIAREVKAKHIQGLIAAPGKTAIHSAFPG